MGHMFRIGGLGMALLLPVAVMAETPNIEPGEWEYTNTITMEEEQFALPEQVQTERECVTREDIAEGLDFSAPGDDGCEVVDETTTRSSLHYTLHCEDPEGGGTSEMELNMELMGDRTEGLMTGEMRTEMGDISVRVEMVGERIGDC